jgi:hypothetical protein
MKEKNLQCPVPSEVNPSDNNESNFGNFLRRNSRKVAATLTISMALSCTGCATSAAENQPTDLDKTTVETKDPSGSIDSKYNDALKNIGAVTETITPTPTPTTPSSTEVNSNTDTQVKNGSSSVEVKPTTTTTETKSTPAPTVETKPTTVAVNTGLSKETNTEKIKKAFSYMAGHDYTSVDSAGLNIMKQPNGADVLVAAGSNTDVLKKIKNQSANKFIYVWNNEAYIFYPTDKSRDGYFCQKVSQNGTETVLQYATNLSWDLRNVAWDKNLGIVYGDDYKITHKYDSAKNKWVELSEYKMLGTAEQRFNKHLQSMVSESVNGVSNPLSLDPAEVKSYIENKDDSNFKTFKVVKDSAGKPAFIVDCSTANGLSERYTQLTVDMFQRINSIDPGLVRLIADRYGVSCYTRDIAKQDIFGKNPGFLGTYINYKFGPVIFFNEKSCQSNIDAGIQIKELKETYAKGYVMSALLCESKAVYNHMHELPIAGMLGDNTGQDKALWVLGKLDTYYNNKQITDMEYNVMKSYMNTVLEYYKTH